MITKIILPFLIALQFLTKVPVTLPHIPTPKQNAYSVLYYPLIGLMIGGLLWAVAVYLPAVPIVKGAVITALWVWITGGLHLDGLSDTVDGFVGGYGDKERTLAIMKDPHIGAMGVMAIVVAILLKFALIVGVLQNNGNLLALLFVPIIGRLSLLYLLLSTPYIRQNGLGSVLSTHLPKRLTIIILILSLLSIFILPIRLSIGLLLIFFLIVFYLHYWFQKRIGGITGDTLGAGVEMVEIGGLFGVVFLTF